MKPNWKSNIFAMHAVNGTCGVCGAEAKLTHADHVTPLRVGECCKMELWIADAFLEVAGRKAGVCHPQL